MGRTKGEKHEMKVSFSRLIKAVVVEDKEQIIIAREKLLGVKTKPKSRLTKKF